VLTDHGIATTAYKNTRGSDERCSRTVCHYLGNAFFAHFMRITFMVLLYYQHNR